MTLRFDPFARPAPRWFTIPAHRPFLEDLAEGVLAWLGDAPPETLSDALVLLPNRRAARAFGQALAKQSAGRPVLLPQVRALGDLEEDEPPFTPGALGLELPPAIAPLRRRFAMARMITERFDADMNFGHALELADAVGALLDSCQLEEIEDLDRIQTLAQADLPEHWRHYAEFLGLAVREWPLRLAEMGLVDPAWKRARLLRMLAEDWKLNPPRGPVIAAGSTGTAPAAADVLGAVAKAPQGCVVVPGLDRDLDDAAWTQIDEQHPQSALKRLLDRHGVDRMAVAAWLPRADDGARHARERLLNEALRPAEATDEWRDAIVRLRDQGGSDAVEAGLQGLSSLTARGEDEAASAIALMMRETLETPDKTCALVTPDLELGRRVAARLERWGVTADVSSGQPLSRRPIGSLILLAARFLHRPLKPATLLGLAKHPMATLAVPGGDAAAALEAMERYGLRGPAPRDWAGLRRALLKSAQARFQETPENTARRAAEIATANTAVDALEGLSSHGVGFAPVASVDAAAAALTALVEALAGQDAWAGRDGEAAAALLSALIAHGDAAAPLTAAQFERLITSLVEQETVRLGGASHPRLRILGAIEARLVRADRMILAGLEDGVWPRTAPGDPFLSRTMRQALKLPPPERRLGQTAQDFIQAACADEVVLVHCERRGGQPAVRSRWLWRLEMLLKGAGRGDDGPPPALPRATQVIGWTRALDAPPPGPTAFATRPTPRPPREMRPRKLPVTSVERWVRDPYAIYAARILGLDQLDRPDASAAAIARGHAVHAAAQKMVETWPNALPDDAPDQIEAWLTKALVDEGFDRADMAREGPLAARMAVWLAAFEQQRRHPNLTIQVEAYGQTELATPSGPFTLTARADRIEQGPEGAVVIDFKTGQPPTAAQVRSGLAPQLTLSAAILGRGGFEGIQPGAVRELDYIKLTGRGEGGKVIDVSKPDKKNPLTPDELAERALEGLIRRIAWFDNPDHPYASWPVPQFMGRFAGNYDHLARVWEWHVVGGEDDGGEDGE